MYHTCLLNGSITEIHAKNANRKSVNIALVHMGNINVVLKAVFDVLRGHRRNEVRGKDIISAGVDAHGHFHPRIGRNPLRVRPLPRIVQ